MILFSTERMPADVVALGVMVVLVLTGLLPVELAFAGFGSEAVLMILGLLILTAALVRTGVVDLAGRALLRRTGNDPNSVLVSMMAAPAVLSTFMSNTASAAFFLPVAVTLARRARISVSQLLMPLAFATILASSVTLIATSTNIVVSGLMVQYGMAPIGMFELTPVGLPIMVLGLLYMFFIGRRMIPNRASGDENANGFQANTYLTETLILPGSPIAGKTLAESGLGRDLDLTVVRVIRGKSRYLAPQANLELEEGDVLLVEGERDEILKIKNKAGIDI